ncbi:nucleoside hydrolase [Corynebacterium comes]|uniref:Pyrimidine-specific ribonucleoside hydrolase RihA n=1 Tax=Corynebacterium comes TaxID=2675218 RepID=A0A6B8WBU3_9CORY|nr:nucleoside hydrolase [Corynebacterium comes]QGU04298.1 Pyrimidine-specific ribonucleoside hydrolase RihA [Corynebacterium comes]
MIPVLIDCDPGIDDTLALIYLAALHHLGEIELVGVTTTAGNTTATQAAGNARWVLAQLLIDAPVLPGRPRPRHVELTTTPETHGPTGLGYLEVPEAPETPGGDWAEVWRGAVDKHADLRLIVTGPLSNLAAFQQTHPEHYARLGNITVMGGAVNYRGNTTPTAEWNFWVDPHAAAEVFEDPPAASIRLCSLEVTEQFLIDPARLGALVDSLGATPVAGYLADILRFYFEFHRAQGEGYQAQIHDLLTCMIALGTIPYEDVSTTIAVEADSPLLRGTSVADLRGHWDRPHNARLVTSADVEAAHSELARAAGALAVLWAIR